jgi:hypothetical protein
VALHAVRTDNHRSHADVQHRSDRNRDSQPQAQAAKVRSALHPRHRQQLCIAAAWVEPAADE